MLSKDFSADEMPGVLRTAGDAAGLSPALTYGVVQHVDQIPADISWLRIMSIVIAQQS